MGPVGGPHLDEPCAGLADDVGQGKEVISSRGQQVEIGGSFRLEFDLNEMTLTSITGFETQDRIFGDNVNSHPLQLSSITHDEELAKTAAKVAAQNFISAETAASLVDRSVDAIRQVNANANLAMLVDAWVCDLATATRTGLPLPVVAV